MIMDLATGRYEEWWDSWRKLNHVQYGMHYLWVEFGRDLGGLERDPTGQRQLYHAQQSYCVWIVFCSLYRNASAGLEPEFGGYKACLAA
jgi:hypothetical protein